MGAYYRLINVDWAEPVKLSQAKSRVVVGDVVNGEQLFKARACVTCHSNYGQGNLLGPDLGDIGDMFNRNEFLVAVNQPSRGIKTDYETVEVVKKDGSMLMGRITSTDEENLSIMMMGNTVIDIPKGEVNAVNMKEKQSLMPPGLLSGLAPSELNDLLAYLKIREINLCFDGKASSPDGLDTDNMSGDEQAAIDGNEDTFWDEVDDQAEYRFKVTFKFPQSISTISIKGYLHHNFAPKSFDIISDGKVIKTITDAIYDDNRWLHTLPSFECTELELRIFDKYGRSPAIRELELFP